MNDPFSFLRSLVPSTAAGVGSDTPGTDDSGTASTLDADLFSGSEPVPAEPADTAPAEAGGPEVVNSNSALVVNAGPAPVETPVSIAGAPHNTVATIPGDVLATMQAALIDLDDRLKVVEVYLRQNGVL